MLTPMSYMDAAASDLSSLPEDTIINRARSLINQVGKKAEDLTSFDRDDENIELIWRYNAGAYDLSYIGIALVLAANEGNPFIGATLFEEDKPKPFDG